MPPLLRSLTPCTSPTPSKHITLPETSYYTVILINLYAPFPFLSSLVSSPPFPIAFTPSTSAVSNHIFSFLPSPSSFLFLIHSSPSAKPHSSSLPPFSSLPTLSSLPSSPSSPPSLPPSPPPPPPPRGGRASREGGPYSPSPRRPASPPPAGKTTDRRLARPPSLPLPLTGQWEGEHTRACLRTRGEYGPAR